MHLSTEPSTQQYLMANCKNCVGDYNIIFVFSTFRPLVLLFPFLNFTGHILMAASTSAAINFRSGMLNQKEVIIYRVS